jgi:hypothetical protein
MRHGARDATRRGMVRDATRRNASAKRHQDNSTSFELIVIASIVTDSDFPLASGLRTNMVKPFGRQV